MRASLQLVWVLVVRQLFAHRARVALASLGIAVGVALAVAVGAIGSSIESSLRALSSATASRANLEVRPNGGVGLTPNLLGDIRETGLVKTAGATIESYVRIRNGTREVRALVVGMDQGIIAMAPAAVSPDVIRAANPFGLLVPNSVANDLGVRPGGRMQITTPRGWRSVPIGAVLAPGEADRSRVVLGSVGILQSLLGRGPFYDAIYVEADNIENAMQRLKEVVGDVGRVGPVAFRSEQVQRLVAGVSASLSVGAMVALLVGAFLVYNTMTMVAVERLREAALLRALGARRRQIFALFLTHGGLLGVFGTGLGAVAGVLLARSLLTQQGTALEDVYPIQFTHLEVEPRAIIFAGATGVFAALVATAFPARRAARAAVASTLGPISALEDPTRGSRRLALFVGIAGLIAGPLIAVPSVQSGVQASNITVLGFMVTLLGIALLIPTVVPPIARVLLRQLARLKVVRGVGRLAAGEIVRAPGRTAFTVGAVLLSLGLVIGFVIAQASFTQAFDLRFKDIISADLYVLSPTWRPLGSDVPLDEKFAAELEKIPGVAAAWPFRLMPAQFDGHPLIVLAYDTAAFAKYSRLSPSGLEEARRQARALQRPNSVLASPSFLARLGYDVGEAFDLPTATGRHRLRIVGVFNDPTALNPELVFDYSEFRRTWGAGGADSFAVAVRGADRTNAVKAEIGRHLGSEDGFKVDTQEQYRDRLSGIVSSVQQLLGSVQLVAMIVAGLGLANTLLISTMERKRELGVLRAIGMLRRELRRMVVAEALMIGVLGVLLGWAVGSLVGIAMYAFIQSQLGVELQLVFPPAGYIVALVLGLATAWVASVLPARRAGRTNIVDALSYD